MTSTMDNPNTAQGGLFDLSGKRALVTGASRGLGRALAVGLAAHGAHVLGVARSADGLAETVSLATDAPGRVEAHTADLRGEEAIERCVDAAAEALGGIDILVNNAGADHDAAIEDEDLATFRSILELNLESCWLVARACSPHLQSGEGGKVINVASMLGLVAVRDDSAYIASKHAVIGLTKALALEWARRNVQVNGLAPGFFQTDMIRNVLADEAIARWIKRNTPMGRWAQPEELVGPAVFLASRASDFMTGHVIVVDGGWTVQ